MQRYIRNVQQFAQLDRDDIRSILLKFLKPEQYNDVIRVMSKMPHIDFQVRCEGEPSNSTWKFGPIALDEISIAYFVHVVIDDEASTVFTAGAIVTVTVVLKRRTFGEMDDDMFKDKSIIENNEKEQKKQKESSENKEDVEGDEEKSDNEQSQQNKVMVALLNGKWRFQFKIDRYN